MQQRHSNFLAMVSGTLDGLEEKKELWNNEEEIVNQVTAIKTEYDSVNAKIKTVEGTDLKGYTQAKNAAMKAFLKPTFKIAKKASAYAKKNHDEVLLSVVNVSLSDLGKGMQKEVVARCSGILNQIGPKLSLMTSYKITNADITGVVDLITAYDKKYNARTSAQGEKSTIFDEIDDHCFNLHQELDILDDLIDGMFDDENSFIAFYKNLRVIKDYGVKKTSSNKPKAKE